MHMGGSFLASHKQYFSPSFCALHRGRDADYAAAGQTSAPTPLS